MSIWNISISNKRSKGAVENSKKETFVAQWQRESGQNQNWLVWKRLETNCIHDNFKKDVL